MVYEHDFIVFCVLIVVFMNSDRFGCITNIVILTIFVIIFITINTSLLKLFVFSYYHNTIIIVSTILMINVIIIIMIIISMIIINVIIKISLKSFHKITVIMTLHIYILGPIFDLFIFSYSNLLIFYRVWCASMAQYFVVLRSHRLVKILHHFANTIEDVYCVNAYCV